MDPAPPERRREPVDARLLRPAPPVPAAAQLKPALLLSLQAFETVVRLGSFKAAAAALHLSPSAVSHRIRNLERMLGDALFHRGHRSVQPTDAGAVLAAATGSAFADLLRASAPAGAPGVRRNLRLSATRSFATQWLIPRLQAFADAHPEIALQVEPSNRTVDLATEPFDAAITVGNGNWPDLAATRLFDIWTTPVAAPGLAAQRRLRRPSDIAAAPLIQVASYPSAWPVWFAGAGVGGIGHRVTLTVDSFDAAALAAQHGAGVALGLLPLCQAQLADGSLCQPVAFRQPTGSYWLLHRPGDRRLPALRAFRRWLTSQVG